MEQDKAGAGFSEGWVEADGFRIRYMQAGEGPVLVHVHGAGGLRLTRGHDLLCQKRKVIVFEMPGFGRSPENTRSRTTADLAETMGAAIRALDIASCDLLGTSFGARVALWLTVQSPELVSTLVLESPAAIRRAGSAPPSGAPEDRARVLYAHPERFPPPPIDPNVQARTQAFVMRVRGPDRDPDLEAAMRRVDTPTLVLFGTRDVLMPPELGRHYKALLPNAHLVFVYDAGHAISTERPEAFADVTLDFLQRREAFVINRHPTLICP